MIKVLETDSPNEIKIKFLGDEEYLGKIIEIFVSNKLENVPTEDIISYIESEVLTLIPSNELLTSEQMSMFTISEDIKEIIMSETLSEDYNSINVTEHINQAYYSSSKEIIFMWALTWAEQKELGI